jgi:hypothetical protein
MRCEMGSWALTAFLASMLVDLVLLSFCGLSDGFCSAHTPSPFEQGRIVLCWNTRGKLRSFFARRSTGHSWQCLLVAHRNDCISVTYPYSVVAEDLIRRVMELFVTALATVFPCTVAWTVAWLFTI